MLDMPERIMVTSGMVWRNRKVAPMALSAYPEEKKPSACVGCRSCEAVCPQQIKISEVMKDSLCGRYPCEKYQGPDGFDPFTTHQRRSGTGR